MFHSDCACNQKPLLRKEMSLKAFVLEFAVQTCCGTLSLSPLISKEISRAEHEFRKICKMSDDAGNAITSLECQPSVRFQCLDKDSEYSGSYIVGQPAQSQKPSSLVVN